jgi:hypothetical protein
LVSTRPGRHLACDQAPGHRRADEQHGDEQQAAAQKHRGEEPVLALADGHDEG